jgi:hypothetical protein
MSRVLDEGEVMERETIFSDESEDVEMEFHLAVFLRILLLLLPL